MKKLRLGTRKSLLAIAQSSWVKSEIERLNPGVQVELVGMNTQGDNIQHLPLSKIEGKDFFTAELDQCLLRKDTDLTVHSMKDLSLTRPSEFTLAAIPKRELSHDLIVFHERVIERIQKKLPIRIGTSSPRRLALLPKFLEIALPRYEETTPILQFVEIRGNVNTRLSRVHEGDGSEKQLDAVVLAFAGLERLFLSSDGQAALKDLLRHTRFLLAPLSENPTAPAQGALAVECRADDQETLALIRKLHDPETEADVQREREILLEWGGGCHQKLGASVLLKNEQKDHRSPLRILGVHDQKGDVSELRDAPKAFEKPFQFTVLAESVFHSKPTFAKLPSLTTNTALFIAHTRAFEFLSVDDQNKIIQSKVPVWVSGFRSWQKLAQKGVWVQGCLEGAGFPSLQNFLQKRILNLKDHSWIFLSHQESHTLMDSPVNANLLGTYFHEFHRIPEEVFSSQSLYWATASAFIAVWDHATPEQRQILTQKVHFSGPGKTEDALRSKGLVPTIFREV